MTLKLPDLGGIEGFMVHLKELDVIAVSGKQAHLELFTESNAMDAAFSETNELSRNNKNLIVYFRSPELKLMMYTFLSRDATSRTCR
jgi:hypothetical protein